LIEHALAFGTDCIGLRFQNVTVPKGATISSARIVFTAKNNWSAATQVDIKGQASDNATFMDVDIKNNISDRPTTTVAVSWSPGPWENGKSYATPDLSAIVNEIVHRSGWADGNAMLFRVAGSGFPGTLSGHREAYSQESDPHSAPVLYIEFIDQSAGTRYYGYFNPDYFYRHSSNVFFPAYKKVEYVPSTNSWKVKTLAGVDAVLTDGDIAPAIKSNGLWDGTFLKEIWPGCCNASENVPDGETCGSTRGPDRIKAAGMFKIRSIMGSAPIFYRGCKTRLATHGPH
jgi:hypothetical protein